MKTKNLQIRIAAIAMIVAVFFTASTKAQITQVENLFGKYALSVDGCENNDGPGIGGSCPITINKPVGASLFKSYLVATQTVIDGSAFPIIAPLRVNTTNVYAGSIGPNLTTLATSGGSGSECKTRYANVTTELTALLNGLPTGPSTLYLIPDANQCNDGGCGLEGRTLIVIWNDPNGSDKVISMALGSTTSLPPTTFTVVTPPLNITVAGSTATAGLGINFSTGDFDQVNNLSVNTTLMSTEAGGWDDGSVSSGLANGNLFTIGDDADALGPLTEKYDIKTALVNGSTSYTVTFENVQGHAYDYCSVYYSIVSDAFQSGNIAGTLYIDANTNLIYNTGEAGLPANITVDLYRDIDGTPGLNTATDQLVGTALTDANGQYTFQNVTVGTNYMLVVNTADPDIPSNLNIETANPVLNVSSINAATATVDFGFVTTTPCDPATNITNSAAICGNQTYTLPSGVIVSVAGTYADTVRNLANTCDSIIHVTNLTVFPFTGINTPVHICPGQTYTLPSGVVVSVAGNYADTIRNAANTCDSIIRTIQLTIDQPVHVTTNAHICPGQTYTLPAGLIVSVEGSYIDTLHSQATCDSLITTTNVIIDHAVTQSLAPHICPGQTYLLPSGATISADGNYIDTVRNVSGCDSLISNVQLHIDQVAFVNLNAQICSNQTYQLPSGIVVSAAGNYVDTVRGAAGCDSLINTIHLSVNAISHSNYEDSIYAGETYTLPSGVTVSEPGTYESILVNSLGCDSTITTLLKLKQSVEDCLVLTNAFTPNGDAIHDYWVLYRYQCFMKLGVIVYNRYGSKVYNADDYKNDWDGRYKGKTLPDGTYYYIIHLQLYNGHIRTIRGNVTILR